MVLRLGFRAVGTTVGPESRRAPIGSAAERHAALHELGACDSRHIAPAPPRRILARERAALALTSADGRGIVPPSASLGDGPVSRVRKGAFGGS